MSRARVEINYSRCQGMGICEELLPDVFHVGDDGQSHVNLEGAEKADLAALEEAARSCPTQSIRVVPDTP